MKPRVKEVVLVAIISSIVIISISLIVGLAKVSGSGDNIKDEEMREDAATLVTSILSELRDNNAILNLREKDRESTMYFNKKGEVFVTDADTYYIFRNDGRLVFFGVDNDLDTNEVKVGTVIKEEKDIISKLIDDINTGKNFSIETDVYNGEIKYDSVNGDRITIGILKTEGNWGLAVGKEIEGSAGNQDTNDSEVKLMWMFEGYYAGSDWELDSKWYEDSGDKQELLESLIDELENKAQEMVKGVCPTLSISAKEYMDSDYDQNIFDQLVKDTEYMGYDQEINKEEFDKRVKTMSEADREKSLFEIIMRG